MTEKQFIKMLKNIKEHCSRQTSCKNCVFRKDACQLEVLARRLYDLPLNWDIEKIEKLINE